MLIDELFQSAIEDKFLYSNYTFILAFMCLHVYVCIHRMRKQFEIDGCWRLIISMYMYSTA